MALFQETYPAACRGRAILLFGVKGESGTFERLPEPLEIPMDVAAAVEHLVVAAAMRRASATRSAAAAAAAAA